jgi:hypothetical protein
MYVYVCFDVEDLVHPDSDDIAKDIAAMLADDGIVATMCVVGEKARLWEQRGRKDVIAAVAYHDVSLHTDHHSVHPTVSEYLADKGWEDGVGEAIRQESPGVRDLTRIFGQFPSSWGTGGNSWGPQIPSATRQLGIVSNIYSDAHAGETGACWYAGQLCFHDYVEFPGGEDAYCADGDFEDALPSLLRRVEEFRSRGFACLGFFAAHPTRLRYTQFWDAINFANGEETDPKAYRFAPRRGDDGYRAGLRNLRRAVLAVRDLPGVEIIPLRALNHRFLTENSPITWSELRRLAQAIVDADSSGIEVGRVSLAQALDALARGILRQRDGRENPEHLLLRTVLGPVEEPPRRTRSITVSVSEVVSTCRGLVTQIDEMGHLPASMEIGETCVGPMSLLRAFAVGFLRQDRGRAMNDITLPPMETTVPMADELAQRIYQEYRKWPPHPADLRLDRLALYTRLQCWTLKPASLAS